MYDLVLLARAHAATDPMAPPERGRHLREAYDAARSSSEAAGKSTILDATTPHTRSVSFALWWWRHGIFPLMVLVTFGKALAAQTVSSIEPGDRLRIQSEEISGEFNVVEV